MVHVAKLRMGHVPESKPVVPSSLKEQKSFWLTAVGMAAKAREL